MTDQSAIDMAVKRLALALDALDAAVERRREADRSEEALANQVQALGLDRTRLAAALDGETARSRRLESTNREIAERLDAAIASIQSVLDGGSRRKRDDTMSSGHRQHRRPPVPPRLRGRSGGAPRRARQGHRRAHHRAAPQVRRDRRYAADRDGGADGGGRIGRGRAPDTPAGGGDRGVAGCARGVRRPRQARPRRRWSTPSTRRPSASRASPRSSTPRWATAWRSDSRQVPVSAAIEQRIRAAFGRQRFMTTLGASLASVREGEVEIDLPFSDALTQQHGFHSCRRGDDHRRHRLRLCRPDHDAGGRRGADHRIQG